MQWSDTNTFSQIKGDRISTRGLENVTMWHIVKLQEPEVNLNKKFCLTVAREIKKWTFSWSDDLWTLFISLLNSDLCYTLICWRQKSIQQSDLTASSLENIKTHWHFNRYRKNNLEAFHYHKVQKHLLLSTVNTIWWTHWISTKLASVFTKYRVN